MQYEENADIAFLAASTEKEMRKNLAGSNIKYNKTDFRQFLQNPGAPSQYPQHGNGHYPPPQGPMGQYPQPQQYQQQYQQQHAPQYPGQDYMVPEGNLPPSNARFIPVPAGVPISPLGGQSIASAQLIEPVNSFNVPDYSKKYMDDEQEFRDALIKEVKSQKKTINKLNRDIEAIILKLDTILDIVSPVPTPVPTPADEITNQPEGI